MEILKAASSILFWYIFRCAFEILYKRNKGQLFLDSKRLK